MLSHSSATDSCTGSTPWLAGGLRPFERHARFPSYEVIYKGGRGLFQSMGGWNCSNKIYGGGEIQAVSLLMLQKASIRHDSTTLLDGVTNLNPARNTGSSEGPYMKEDPLDSKSSNSSYRALYQ